MEWDTEKVGQTRQTEKDVETSESKTRRERTETKADGAEEWEADRATVPVTICNEPTSAPLLLLPSWAPSPSPDPPVPPFCRPPLSDAVPTPQGFSLTSTTLMLLCLCSSVITQHEQIESTQNKDKPKQRRPRWSFVSCGWTYLKQLREAAVSPGETCALP